MTATQRDLSLLTDLYQLTMAAVYFDRDMRAPATFSLFIREYPPDRAGFISLGLEEVLEYLETFHFTPEQLDYLERTGRFSDSFLHHLSGLRFTGSVRAIPEGRMFFKDEPILEVTGPILEAQLVETCIINRINHAVAIGTKAARCVEAAEGRKLLDFSLRRTHGTDAGLTVARSSYAAGFDATSNVLAGERYGIPISGTMAHAFITSFDEEIEAFRAFAKVFPENTVLLIDSYDTITGAKKATQVAAEMAERGHSLRGVRLDSGDMTALSKEVRAILDDAGFTDVAIFASGGYDEHKIADAVANDAQIDGFGVGTKMGVSADAPYLDIAYKLVQYDNRPVLKLSSGKKTLVGEKQVYRAGEGERYAHDTICLKDETAEGRPLLEPAMIDGRRLARRESLETIRDRFRADRERMNPAHLRIKNPEPYPVRLGPVLEELQGEVIQEIREKELGES
jgi:nicotinate phosphoribosyltransferase